MTREELFEMHFDYYFLPSLRILIHVKKNDWKSNIKSVNKRNADLPVSLDHESKRIAAWNREDGFCSLVN